MVLRVIVLQEKGGFFLLDLLGHCVIVLFVRLLQTCQLVLEALVDPAVDELGEELLRLLSVKLLLLLHLISLLLLLLGARVTTMSLRCLLGRQSLLVAKESFLLGLRVWLALHR